jgi:hypothetical protein
MFFARAARFGARRCSAAFSSLVVASDFLVRIYDADGKGDSAAGGELCSDDCFARRACFHKIVEDTVRNRFVERALVPIRGQIKFQGLALDAETVWHVIDVNPGKIGLTRYRTNGSEIISFKMNPVIPAGRRIRKRLEPRVGGRRRDSRFASSEES